jgi:hypothetical protein
VHRQARIFSASGRAAVRKPETASLSDASRAAEECAESTPERGTQATDVRHRQVAAPEQFNSLSDPVRPIGRWECDECHDRGECDEGGQYQRVHRRLIDTAPRSQSLFVLPTVTRAHPPARGSGAWPEGHQNATDHQCQSAERNGKSYGESQLGLVRLQVCRSPFHVFVPRGWLGAADAGRCESDAGCD